MYVIDINKTASGGEWSFNTLKIVSGKLEQVLIEATNNDTVFDFSMTDKNGNEPIDTSKSNQSGTGFLNILPNIPLAGIYTVKVFNSSLATETFTGRIIVAERSV